MAEVMNKVYSCIFLQETRRRQQEEAALRRQQQVRDHYSVAWKTAISPCCSSHLQAHLPGKGTSARQRQKFHTDDVNYCLHNKSGSHGLPNVNPFDLCFSWSIMVIKVFVFCCERAPANHKCFFYRGMYSTNIDCLVVDSVVYICLLSLFVCQ